MARGAARNGPRRSVLRPEIALRRRNQPRFGVPAEQHYWMASSGALFSVALRHPARQRLGFTRSPESTARQHRAQPGAALDVDTGPLPASAHAPSLAASRRPQRRTRLSQRWIVVLTPSHAGHGKDAEPPAGHRGIQVLASASTRDASLAPGPAGASHASGGKPRQARDALPRPCRLDEFELLLGQAGAKRRQVCEPRPATSQ